MKNTMKKMVLMMSLGLVGMSSVQAELVYICHKDRSYCSVRARSSQLGHEIKIG